jgi:hypothetical protein
MTPGVTVRWIMVLCELVCPVRYGAVRNWSVWYVMVLCELVCPVRYGAVRNWSVWYVMMPSIVRLDISHHGNATATFRSLPRPDSNNGSVLLADL